MMKITGQREGVAVSTANNLRKITPSEKAATAPKRRGRPLGSTNKPKPPPPALNVPNFEEWSDFIGDFVLRWFARAYVSVALRGIDRSILTKDEDEALELDDEELEAISKPFAHVATRSKFLSKHGRMIIDSRDALEASVVLFMWGNRVRAIGKKYRVPKNPRKAEKLVRQRQEEAQRSGQNVEESEGTANGRGFAPPAFGHGYN